MRIASPAGLGLAVALVVLPAAAAQSTLHGTIRIPGTWKEQAVFLSFQHLDAKTQRVMPWRQMKDETREDGVRVLSWSLPGAAPGEYLLTVLPFQTQALATVGDGKTEMDPVTLEIPAPREIRIEVVNQATGQLVTDLASIVQKDPAADERATAVERAFRAGPTGAFVAVVPEGIRTFVVKAPQYRHASKKVDVRGTTKTVRIEVEPATGIHLVLLGEGKLPELREHNVELASRDGKLSGELYRGGGIGKAYVIVPEPGRYELKLQIKGRTITRSLDLPGGKLIECSISLTE